MPFAYINARVDLRTLHDVKIFDQNLQHLVIVSTDLTLTTDRLIELFQSVEDPDNVDPVMVEITEGTLSLEDSLGLPLSAMEETRKSYQSNTKRKEAYLDTYAHHHPCPSWKKIS